MAELILQSVVDAAAEHLVSLISQEIGQACGVKGELEKLEMSVSAIRAVLHDAERIQARDAQVKDWLEKLQDVVYDADDLLDDFSTEVLHRKLMKGNRALKEVRIFFSSSNQLAYRVKMAHQVRAIRERLDTISKDKSDFHMSNVGNPTLESKIIASRMARDGVSFLHESNVIGREKDKEHIIGFLLNPSLEEDNTNVSVLPIVGVGGLGKTTLAKFVFNEIRVRKYFHLKLWVCISTDFEIEIIVKNILKECNIPTKELDGLNMNMLQKKLWEVINGRKYLLVLDDVWNENRTKWLDLEQFLANGAKGSKILVTTRSQKVAKITAVARPYMLSGLPEVEGLCLLMQMARKQEGEWKGNRLETIGREIVRKCVGVPLAIKTIGRLLLSSENTEQVWLSFKENDLWRIDQEVDDIMPTLKLSYDYLPSHLKSCLAYCSLFPKDHPLDPQELIDLWISQGFIIKSTIGNQRNPEEVGRGYFMELVWRSFFQDFEEDGHDSIVRCKMHDLIHDLAQLVSGNSCITIGGSSIDDERNQGVARHGSTTISLEKIEGGSKWRKLRSFVCLEESKSYRTRGAIPIFSSFTKLRALGVQDQFKRRVPDSIGKFKHLRYLDLSNNSEHSLSDSISKLHNLEILNLMGNAYLTELPRGFTNLINLRKLNIRDCKALCYLPSGIGKMKCLRLVVADRITLEPSVGGDKRAAGLEELSKLNGLDRKVLVIRELGSGMGRVRSDGHLRRDDEGQRGLWIKETSTFESLAYCWDWKSRAHPRDARLMFEKLEASPSFQGLLSISWYPGDKLPSWIVGHLKYLSSLTITDCYGCKVLPSVHQLPLLRDLCVKWCGFQFSGEDAMTESFLFFPSLTKLRLDVVKEFKGWKMSKNFEEKEEEDHKREIKKDVTPTLTLIPFFNKDVQVNIVSCPELSFMYGKHLCLRGIDNTTLLECAKIMEEMSLIGQRHSMNQLFLQMSSIPFLELESITIQPTLHVQSFPSTFFKPLRSLQVLEIETCLGLKSLQIVALLRYLTALRKLRIFDCPDLDLCLVQVEEEEDPASTIVSSCSYLQLSISLKELSIFYLPKLKFLPGWIRHLPNLEKLTLFECKNLKTLPEWFRQLPSLLHLEIKGCNTLVDWYRKEVGENWPKRLELTKHSEPEEPICHCF